MKAAYVLDQSINIRNASDEYRAVARPVINEKTGQVVDWIVPKGAIVSGDEALFRVSTGQARPADEECAKACGLTDAQIESAMRLNAAANAGITYGKDLDLFMAGVIDGYLPGTTDDKPIYKPGPNKAAFDAIKQAEKAKTEKAAI